MTTELTIAELASAVERELGTSDWHRVEQTHIDLFAEATGDHQWIHLTLSLLPLLLSQVLRVRDMKTRINYGIDRVRFTAPVPSGSEVRARARLVMSERRGDGLLYKLGVEVEVRGEPKPALVGEFIYLVP